MTTLTLRLPDELSYKIEREAQRNHVSMQHYILDALTNSISYAEAEEIVRKKLLHASEMSVTDILQEIPDRQPLPDDE